MFYFIFSAFTGTLTQRKVEVETPPEKGEKTSEKAQMTVEKQRFMEMENALVEVTNRVHKIEGKLDTLDYLNSDSKIKLDDVVSRLEALTKAKEQEKLDDLYFDIDVEDLC